MPQGSGQVMEPQGSGRVMEPQGSGHLMELRYHRAQATSLNSGATKLRPPHGVQVPQGSGHLMELGCHRAHGWISYNER